MPPLICSFSCLFGRKIPLSPSLFLILTPFCNFKQVCIHTDVCVSRDVCLHESGVLFLLSSAPWNPLEHPPSSALKMFSQNKGYKHCRKWARKGEKRKGLQIYWKQDEPTRLWNNYIIRQGWITPVFGYSVATAFLSEEIRSISHRCTHQQCCFLQASICCV